MADSYVRIYQGEVTEGGTDGDLVSSGGDFSCPISVTLGSGDYQIVPLAVRKTTTYTISDVIIYSNDPDNLQLSLTGENDSWTDNISVGTITTTNIIFYARINLNPATLHKTPSFKASFTAPAMPYASKLKCWLPFDDSIMDIIYPSSKQAAQQTQSTFKVSKIITDPERTVSKGAVGLDSDSTKSQSNLFNVGSTIYGETFKLGGTNFTVDGYAYMDSSSTRALYYLFNIDNTSNSTVYQKCQLKRDSTSTTDLKLLVAKSSSAFNTAPITTNCFDRLFHWAIMYIYSSKTWTLYLDGVKVSTLTGVSISSQEFSVFLAGNTSGVIAPNYVIDEVRVFDTALYSADFTPPTAADYRAWKNNLLGLPNYTDDFDVELALGEQSGGSPTLPKSSSLKLTLGYNGTDFERNLTFDNLVPDSIPSASDMRQRIKAINSSVASGTDGGMNTFFVADDYAGDTVGTFNGITAAELFVTSDINLSD